MQSEIFVKDIALNLYIGAFPEERSHPQTVYADVKIVAKNTAAQKTDALADTINYHALTLLIKEKAEASRFALLERLGAYLIECIGNEPTFSYQYLQLTLTKQGVFPEAKCYGLTFIDDKS